MERTVLVAEDDPHIGTLVCTYLQRAGFATAWVRSGEAALAVLARRDMALVVLDLGLPGIDGLEVCRRIGGRVPVIVLTARDEESERIAGLEAGADDYVPKPFSPRELVARVKAVLRRARIEPPRIHVVGPLRLLPAAREVQLEGREIVLTQKEFDLLEYLVERVGTVVTREELLASVWGFLSPGETRTVDVHIGQLRRRLGTPELIRTVRGVGYKVPSP
jgi:two-component system OmpR family response regulator